MNQLRLCPSLALLATFCLAIASPSSAEPREVSEEEIFEIAGNLWDRLAALNSFQAEYAIVSPIRDEQRILLSVNRSKNFAVLHLIRGTDDSNEAFASARFLRADGSIRSFAYLGGDPDGGVSYEITFEEFLGNIHNAAGLFGFLAAITEVEQSLDEPLHPENHGITISLGLERSQLSFGLGFASSTDGISGSWLPLQGRAREVTAVEQSEDYIDFFYPESRVVRVDRATGLLIRDSYPAPGHDSPREIKLVEWREMTEETAMEDLLPEYWKTIPIQEISKEQVEQLILRETLSAVANALPEIDDLASWLEEERISIRESARRGFRNKGLVNVGESDIKEFIQLAGRFYDHVLEEDPSLTYEKFLDRLLDLNERGELLDGTRRVSSLEATWMGYADHLLPHLSPEARLPFTEVYRELVSEIAHAYKLEVMRHVLEEAKARGLKEPTQIPD